jgi:hypothetical protein
MNIAGVSVVSGTVLLTHSLMNLPDPAYLAMQAAEMVVSDLVQITASALISNALAVLILLKILTAYPVDS